MPAYSRKIEALAEAITKYTGYLDPASALHTARNPGGLRPTSPTHVADEAGYRVFLSVLDGYQSLLHDLSVKLSGRSRFGLTPDSELKELAEVYGFRSTTASAWAKFLTLALHTDVLPSTHLKFFTE